MPLTITAQPAPTFSQRTWSVWKAWFRHPTQVASVCPSSRFLTRALAERDCVRAAERIIELGPGPGGTTAALLAQLRPDARLLAVEKSAEFASDLNSLADPRLDIVFGDAAELIEIAPQHAFPHADVIVSGIPFSSLPTMTAKQVAESAYEVLRPGGEFIAYQLRSDVTSYVTPIFGPPSVQSVPLNLPPLSIFRWTKVAAP